MIEIELFFKFVESEIRRKHIKYLKKQKCISVTEQNLPCEKMETAEEDYPKGEKAQYVKRFNKGIDTALKVLQSEYKAYAKRMEAEKAGGKKY